MRRAIQILALVAALAAVVHADDSEERTKIHLQGPVERIDCSKATSSEHSKYCSKHCPKAKGGMVIVGSMSSSGISKKGFYEAARTGNVKLVAAELGKVNSRGLEIDWANPDHHGYTALHVATNNSHTPVVVALLDAGANPNVKEKQYGRSPLHIAAIYGHITALEALLEPQYGAEIDLQSDNIGATPIYYTASSGQPEAMQLLVDRGANVNQVLSEGTYKGSSPLAIASQKGNVDTTRVLINAGAEIDYARPRDGLTALHSAAMFDRVDVALLLLQHGADSNIRSKSGNTAADLSRDPELGDGSVATIIDNYA